MHRNIGFGVSWICKAREVVFFSNQNFVSRDEQSEVSMEITNRGQEGSSSEKKKVMSNLMNFDRIVE